jgi:hypothetical protein
MIRKCVDVVKKFLFRVGHIDVPEPFSDESLHLDVVDQRLDALELEQRKTAARLRLLEIQGTPRGGFRG